MMHNRMEILAPAGSPDALRAAVRCGADAVYLGASVLNARRNAKNFDDDTLQAAVRYCHARSVAVYLTVNTLIKERELPQAIALLKQACALGIDALIVQDLGMARLAHHHAPQMPLHASTQMSIQTADGFSLLERLGFTRAVLPRELSRQEIAAIQQSCNLALEVFVHGALCMSVSGQCLMSAVLGARSGNRGLCAQPCRLPFSCGSQQHALSLKDLSLIEALPELAQMGIASVKIEGRMKRPEYVAAAVTACRNARDGIADEVLTQQLRQVFSRSGFTDGYFQGVRGASLFGTRQKEDVTAAKDALPQLAQLYPQEHACIPVQFALTARAQQPLTLTASSSEHTVCVEAAAPQPAQTRTASTSDICSQLEKCGGTPFFAREITVDLSDDLYIPASQLNALRRNALQQLEDRLSERAPLPFLDVPAEVSPARAYRQANRFQLRVQNVAQIPADLGDVSRIIVPLDTPGEQLAAFVKNDIPYAVEIPRAIFGNRDTILRQLIQAKGTGIALAVAGTLDGIALAQQAGLCVSAGFGIPVMNTQAIQQLAQWGVQDVVVSCEATLTQIAHLGGDLPRSLLGYGHLPLMLLRNCPKQSCIGCNPTALVDRKGIVFPVQCHNGVREVLNSRPIYLADRLSALGNVDSVLLHFTQESPAECVKILNAYRQQQPTKTDFTRGLYFRGVT